MITWKLDYSPNWLTFRYKTWTLITSRYGDVKATLYLDKNEYARSTTFALITSDEEQTKLVQTWANCIIFAFEKRQYNEIKVQFRSFICPECGKHVQVQSGPGRFRRYQGVMVPVPEHIPIAMCVSCMESFTFPETEDDLVRYAIAWIKLNVHAQTSPYSD